jgi:ornithine decarboxylase
MTLHPLALAGEPLAVRPHLSRAEGYIADREFDRPTLVIDTARVVHNYAELSAGLGDARIHYAVKANPERAVIEALVACGSGFDAASRGEIELCLSQGASADRISFGNTVKSVRDIAFAHSVGVDLFAVDCAEEIAKVAAHAPGARVYVRVIVTKSEADWPLSRKFGAEAEAVPALMAIAQAAGLRPVGISFHVGSQTRRASMWAATLDEMAGTWRACLAAGFALDLLNIGGGFPAYYGDPVEAPRAYAAQVARMVRERFGDVGTVMAEPGRGLVADAGAIAAEVLLATRKSEADLHRWVYLDIGKFSGLAETIDEAIRYQFATHRDGGAMGPCILAGPSCDSADILYEQRPVMLPAALAAGDRIVIRNCGAYTSSYSSVGFNGFPPLDVVVL